MSMKQNPYRHAHELQQDIELYRTSYKKLLPPFLSANIHRNSWDQPHVQATFDGLLDTTTWPWGPCKTFGSLYKESDAWLNAPWTLGVCMDDEVVCIAVGLCLGVPLCNPHTCCHCGATVSKWAIHGLSCCRSKGLVPLSSCSNINNILTTLSSELSAEQIPSILKPAGLCRSEGRRPNGVTVTGHSFVWDAPTTLLLCH